MPQNLLHASILGWTLLLIALSIGLYTLSNVAISAGTFIRPIFDASTTNLKDVEASNSTDTSAVWIPPNQTQINDLEAVINGTGVYGFIFNDSNAPPGNDYYGGYNWCNMPHVSPKTYIKPPAEYVLEYVEVIHRHHKRTPYAANLFPDESSPWTCPNFTHPSPNTPCTYPEVTPDGLTDAHAHGSDLHAIYHTLLHFLPSPPNNSTIQIRVTNNPLTTQTALAILPGLFPSVPPSSLPLYHQSPTTDSLEPSYPCPASTALYDSIGPGSTDPDWTAHLNKTTPLLTHLSTIANTPPNSKPWHKSYDHFFDNLSSRLCHALPLPCSPQNPSICISPADAATVFRLGEYEYAYLYRSHPSSLRAAAASFGLYVAELAQHLREAMAENDSSRSSKVRYRHNVGHDGSLARFLAVLQVEEMVWPGMGAEVIVELYSRGGEWVVRVLWGGVVLRSSAPELGVLDLVPVERVVGYLERLVGEEGGRVEEMCREG